MPQSPVIRLLPVLERDVPAIAPKDSARPITTAGARLARVGWVQIGVMWIVAVNARMARAQGLELEENMVV